MDKDQQLAALKGEVVRLFEAVQKIKEEIASIKHPLASTDHFDTVADQLAAIVNTTEKATQNIMEATEAIIDGIKSAETAATPEDRDRALRSATDATSNIFEACSFHDLTGQRISKIVKTINLIEGTLNSLVVIVGEDGLKVLPLAASKELDERDEQGLPLHGPALNGQGFSQADIDKLFD